MDYKVKSVPVRLGIAVLISAIFGLVSFVGVNFVILGSTGVIFEEGYLYTLVALGFAIPIVTISYFLISLSNRLTRIRFISELYLFVLPFISSVFMWTLWLVKFKKRSFEVEIISSDWPTYLIAINMGLGFSIYWKLSSRSCDRS